MEASSWASWSMEKLAVDFSTWYRPGSFDPVSLTAIVLVLADILSLKYRFHKNLKRIKQGGTKAKPDTPIVIHKLPLFEVRKSPKGGFGIFATEFLSPMTEVLSESPFLMCTMGEFSTLFPTLPKETRARLFNLHWWPGADANKEIAIFMTNRFEFNSKCAVLDLGSRFNHACYPNCSYNMREIDGKILFRTKKYIQKGEEITISYGHSPYDLWCLYGFMCDCGYCAPPKHLLKANSVGIGSGR